MDIDYHIEQNVSVDDSNIDINNKKITIDTNEVGEKLGEIVEEVIITIVADGIVKNLKNKDDNDDDDSK